MKISEVIEKLQTLQDKYGDYDVNFFVKDHYSSRGHGMDFNVMFDRGGYGYLVHNDSQEIMLTAFSLKSELGTGKQSKVTFRK
jgi:hypothetical protein